MATDQEDAGERLCQSVLEKKDDKVKKRKGRTAPTLPSWKFWPEAKRLEAVQLLQKFGYKHVVLKFGKQTPARTTLRYVLKSFSYLVCCFSGVGRIP